MAFPILYKATETTFDNLGVSVLSDASKCYVTRERNGLYILEFDYPYDGKDAEKIKEGMILKCDAGHRAKNQRFIISKITKTKAGYNFYCKHISQVKTAMNMLRPDIEVSGSAFDALETWRSNLLDSRTEFFVWSDIITSATTTWKVENIENAREALGGKSGSILDVWGGEYEFDNLNIKLHKKMGIDTPTIIAYGKNLVDLEQEESILETYTSVFPFAKIQTEDNQEQLITLPEFVVDSPHANNFTHRRILKVDFSSNEKLKTADQLRKKAESYIKSNKVGVPKVNLKLSYQDLSKVNGIFDNPALEIVDLCDTLKVYYEDLGITNESAKVIKVVWDVILEENHSLEVGDSRSSFGEATGVKFEDLQDLSNGFDEKINKLIEEREAIFNRYFNEKSKIIEDAVKTGIAESNLAAELKLEQLKASFEENIKTTREEVQQAVEDFNNRLNNLDSEALDKIKAKIEDVSRIAETTLKMVGTDDSITYNKNRVDGATEREIPLGTKFIEIAHNGDGFEVGKEYTISWEATCRTHDYTDVRMRFYRPLPFEVRVSLVDRSGLYPTVEKDVERNATEVSLLHVYNSQYDVILSSDWLANSTRVMTISNGIVIPTNVSFKANADGEMANDKYHGEWSDNPQYIFDGGGN